MCHFGGLGELGACGDSGDPCDSDYSRRKHEVTRFARHTANPGGLKFGIFDGKSAWKATGFGFGIESSGLGLSLRLRVEGFS